MQIWRRINMYYVLIVILLTIIVALVVRQYFIVPTEVPVEPPVDAVYLNSQASVHERVKDLMRYMTLREKVGQMALVEKNSVRSLDDISSFGIGALLSGFGGKPEDNSVLGWRTMIEEFTSVSRNSRLGIPILYGLDANHGHANVPGATVFPHFIGLGATNDEQLVEAVARATAEELRATHVRWSYSPTLDIPKDIRWGRMYEAFSDDPEVVARLGVAYLTGLQFSDDDPEKLFILATPKHYLGAGSMVWESSSNNDFYIDQGVTIPDERVLRTEFLPPYQAVVGAGAQSIMVGLNSWGDTKMSAEGRLITTVLKGELGFTGFTVSDWYGVYEIPGSDYRAAVTAINAGIDMVMLPFDYEPFIHNVMLAVHRGEILETRIDDAVYRILAAKFALGLFDEPRSEFKPDVIGSAAHRALARTAVARSQVLLKNEGAVLPLSKNATHIRVAGSAADNIGRQVGAWTVEWQGFDGNELPGATSILEGIREAVGPNTVVEFSEAGTFTESAKADIGIAVVGEQPYAEGWGDTAYPVLGHTDRETIRRLQDTCEQVVVVIVSGRPLLIAEEVDTFDGLVMAWLPGSEGAGVAEVLFGDMDFTGRLPVPWPRHAEQMPIEVNGTTADGTLPLFPRGYGLQ